MISLPLKKGPLYFIFSEIQISSKEEMKVNSLLLIIKAKLPARTLHQQKKKKKKYNICYASGQNLTYGPNSFYFHQGMVRTMK